METQAYQNLCQKLSKQGGRFPGMDIPEFYNLIHALFTPEEAVVFIAMPKDYNPAGTIAENLGRSEHEVLEILEAMADKGLIVAGGFGGIFFYGTTPLENILDFQFMRGTETERDKKIAELYHAYKKAVDSMQNIRLASYGGYYFGVQLNKPTWLANFFKKGERQWHRSFGPVSYPTL